MNLPDTACGPDGVPYSAWRHALQIGLPTCDIDCIARIIYQGAGGGGIQLFLACFAGEGRSRRR